MTKTKGLLFTAGMVLAMAFTFSCDSGGGNGDGGSKGNNIKNYKTVKIGAQTWMAENLDYAGEDAENPIGKCYDDKPSNCNKYGRLYNWGTAKTVCPSGWHLPNKAEWEALGDNAKKLKAKSGWDENGNGTDEFSFSALPGGYSTEGGSFYDVGSYGGWWSTSVNYEVDGTNDYIYTRRMNYDSEDAKWSGPYYKSYRSVRCVQD